MDRGRQRLLVVSGEGADSVVALLASRGQESVRADDVRQASTLLDGSFVAAAFVPVTSPDNLAVLAELRARFPETALIAFGPDSEQLVRGALAEGATEYLPLPPQPATLALVLDTALANDPESAPDPSAASPGAPAGDLLGSSRAMATVRDTIARVAGSSATVLVRGETGTGKELVARAIHAQSARHGAPFIKVHAAALPETLLESELFGYEKGAFTGASKRKPGRVELAQHGTLFLDEIAEVSAATQVKLLRLLQDREYECLGGTRALRADVRLVAATHRDLEDMVRRGAFREDLFYRLNVVTVWLPPLRARRADIASIVEHYLRIFREQAGRRQLTIAPEALRALEGERWPGNVRQLVNFIERLVVLAQADAISAADVSRELGEQLAFLTQAAVLDSSAGPAVRVPSAVDVAEPPVVAGAAEPSPPSAGAQELLSAVRPLREDLRRAELRSITKALQSAKGNRALAARLLGISRRTLYTKLEEHGIE